MCSSILAMIKCSFNYYFANLLYLCMCVLESYTYVDKYDMGEIMDTFLVH